MRGEWLRRSLWTGPLVCAGTALALGLRSALAHAAGCALLALALELAWRGALAGTPVYRRHLLILALAALVGAWHGWAGGLLGATLGLALSCLPLLWTRWMPGLSWRRGVPRRPDPAAPLILVADPHWSEALTGLEPATAAHPEADWLFLGDIFDVWVGIPGMETPLERSFLAWVADRRRAGRWVGFWMGNREYFLDPLAGRFDLMGEGLGGRLPEEGLCWEHGDLVNGADWRYRLWNLISRSGPVWLFARLLPKASAQALARRLQRALHTTNRAYKLAFPRAAFRAAAAEQPAETFITGHFHTHEEEGNGIALPWAHEGTFAVWEKGKVRILS